MAYVDLHCHSTASDGTTPPGDLPRLAAARGVSALALTDHDTVAGVAEAAGAARDAGIDFLPGIEISAEHPHPGTLHILGYGVDPGSAVLGELTRQLLAGRDARNPRIVRRLNDLGIPISMQEVEAEAGGEVVGRPHIAAVLVRRGVVGAIREAFDRYLAPGGLAYFDKERLSPRRAIELIRASGGVAVLAHPVQLRFANHAQLDRIVKDLLDLGLAGIEVLHSDHAEADIRLFEQVAKRYALLRTGGSDFHGAKKPGIALGSAGSRRVPREWFDRLRDAVGEAERAHRR